MRKILSTIVSELKLIFIPTIQFLLSCWLVIVLVATLYNNTFEPHWSVCIFLILWFLCVVSFCGIFWCYKKHVIAYRLACGFVFMTINWLLLFIIDKYSVEIVPFQENKYDILSEKNSLYVLWYGLITFIGVQIYQVGLDSNTQGARCSIDDWKYGDIYQWVWDHTPCQFTADFLIGYLFYIPLYFLFNYVRTKILQTNLSVQWHCLEVGGWCIINWVYLLWLTQTEYRTLDLVLVETSLLGMLLFFTPILLVAIGARFIKIP